ncbi:Gfo/Idh/MocA family protein [Brevibacillus formosus]|uniref:Gfo/Idh/MocA family protein n=1 Tax=Brevibacillus formosus TaxID=54913 RepID=UPI003F193D82
MYRVAVIGAGDIAGHHLRALAEMKQLQGVAIADIQLDRAHEAGRRHHLAPYADYREMVLKEKPDIVVITLPHYLHKEAAVWSAGQGCHILLEKPMALNAAECEEIIQAAKRSNVTLVVGHTQHFKPENRKAKEMIAQGSLGKLVMINDTRHLHYFREGRPDWFFEKAKAGGGIMMNLGAHSVDKIQWLTGSRIVRVKASLSHFGGRGDIEGSGLAFLETSTGVAATVSQSGYRGVPKDETELIFTDGMLKLASGKGLWQSDGGEFRQVELERETDPFALQFTQLLAAIESGNEPDCSGEYAKSVVSVIESIYLSHRLGAELAVGKGRSPV